MLRQTLDQTHKTIVLNCSARLNVLHFELLSNLKNLHRCEIASSQSDRAPFSPFFSSTFFAPKHKMLELEFERCHRRDIVAIVVECPELILRVVEKNLNFTFLASLYSLFDLLLEIIQRKRRLFFLYLKCNCCALCILKCFLTLQQSTRIFHWNDDIYKRRKHRNVTCVSFSLSSLVVQSSDLAAFMPLSYEIKSELCLLLIFYSNSATK